MQNEERLVNNGKNQSNALNQTTMELYQLGRVWQIRYKNIIYEVSI